MTTFTRIPPNSDDLKADAIFKLSELISYMIRDKWDPDHSGPEDEADEFSEAVINSAIALFESSNPRLLPNLVYSQGLLRDKEVP
jgi:hypothetical protein